MNDTLDRINLPELDRSRIKLTGRAGVSHRETLPGQDIRGSDKTYDDLKAAYQTAILAKGCFFTDDSFLHTFEYYDSDWGIAIGVRSGKPR